MARLLVRLADQTHPDPDKDPLITHRGDVIVVKPDGWVWGSAEAPPTYAHVDVPGTVDEWRHLTEPDVVLTRFPGEPGDHEIVRLRTRKIDLGALTQGQRNRLGERSLGLTRAQLVAATLDRPAV